MSAPSTQRITPVFPNKVEFAGRQAVIGANGFQLLSLVLRHGGRVRLLDLAAGVYGEKSVSRNRIATACHRLNQKLLALGVKLRLAVEDDRVALM